MNKINLMEDLSGQTLGRYDVVSPIGEGGMAAVYKAYQPDMERHVALKVLPPQFAKDKQFVARFQQEARALAKLQHPHILPIYDYGTANDLAYLVMPFVAGGDLAQLLRRGRLSLSRAVKIVTQVGEALDYAHGKNIVHRDVKPSNVLINEQGYCLLSDFGLAKMAAQSNTKLTATGLVVGTPEYMSPEQGLGKPIDHRTDIYALGVILFEMLTGEKPFKADTWTAVIMQAINEPLPLPSRINPEVPHGIEAIILQACAKQPDVRYATVHEMVKALETAVSELASYNIQLSNQSADEGSLTELRQRLLAETQAVPAPQLAETVLPITSSSSTALQQQAEPKSSQSVMLPALTIPKWLIAVLAVALLGLIGLGTYAFTQLDNPPPQPPPATEVPALNAPENEVPTAAATATSPAIATPTQQPSPTEPSPQPTLLPSLGSDAENDDRPAPPPAAIDACRNLEVNNACTFNGARGETIEGVCRPLGAETACAPNENIPPSP